MSIRQLKPFTATSRYQQYIGYKDILTPGVSPYSPLIVGLKKAGGRNNTGRITVRHQGGGNKVSYRIIDWKRSIKDVEAVVKTIEYDPNRTAFISLIQYVDGRRSYVLATNGIKEGTKILFSAEADIKPGNALPLRKIPDGIQIHSVEMKPGAGAKMIRSAGGYATLVGKLETMAQLRLSSGEIRLIPLDCWATIGTLTNADHMNISLGKAGRNRWAGVRPTVRGVVMNPVDHPMGGGEGKTSGGRHPCSPWGQLAKGYKTRNKKKTSSKYIVSRRK
jgi:large subunit ribosomal protein L2